MSSGPDRINGKRSTRSEICSAEHSQGKVLGRGSLCVLDLDRLVELLNGIREPLLGKKELSAVDEGKERRTGGQSGRVSFEWDFTKMRAGLTSSCNPRTCPGTA